jgi:hypothetical protein
MTQPANNTDLGHAHDGFPQHVTRLGAGVWDKDCPHCAAALELPFQTYERVYGMPWPGGRSETIVVLLRTLGVMDPPGSAEANLRMQEILLRRGL